jgi:hypothetical protein
MAPQKLDAQSITKSNLDYLISEFSTSAMQRYTDANTRGFTSQILNVVFTWGEGTLKIRASPFITAPNGMMQKTYHSQDGHPLGVESLPVGLTEANMILLEQTCLEELDHKIANREFVTGITCYRTSDISRSILETVFRYYHMMPIVSKLYQPYCSPLILKAETPAYPLHSPAAVSNTRHQ